MIGGTLNRAVWLALALAIGVLAWSVRRDIFDIQEKTGTLSVSHEGNVLILEWRGRIDAPMADRITEAVDAHNDTAKKIILALFSGGGSVDHGVRVRRLLETIAATHELETTVGPGRVCASMCVPVYLAAKTRSAARSARFMFHEISYRDYLATADNNVPQASLDAAMDRFFDRYFIPAGVKRDWIERIKTQIRGGNEVWKTARELEDENAGLVQRVF